MKFLLLALIVSLPAFAIPLSLQNMRPDKSYFSFAAGKYLTWHLRHFHFPVLSPLEKDLISNLDHWNVPDSEALSQLSLCHREVKGRGTMQSLRLWISPGLRSRKEFRLNTLPDKFVPWFYERNTDGLSCLIGQTGENIFEAWCRAPGRDDWKFHHRETIADEHHSWKNVFPLMTPEEVRISDKDGTIKAISYHRGMTHVSLIPRPLLMVVRAHSQDTAFGFERFIIEADRTMSVCYP